MDFRVIDDIGQLEDKNKYTYTRKIPNTNTKCNLYKNQIINMLS